MNRFISLSVAVVFASFALVPAFASASTNLIKNPSFENGTTGWSTVIGSWNSTSFTYPVTGFDGLHAAGIKVTSYSGGDIFWQPSNAPVTPGAQYTFSGYSLNNVPVYVIATYLNSFNKAVSYATVGTMQPSPGWQQFSATITVPANATAVRIQHVIRSRGILEVDQYSLTLAPTGGTGTTTPPPPPPPPLPPPPPAPTCSISASPTAITAGNTSTLSWTSTNASTSAIDQGLGAVAASGSKAVSPTATTTYTMTVANVTATSTCKATINVAPVVAPPPPLPPADNLILNGDLESGTTNNPTGWNADWWGTMNANFTYPVAGNGGGKAAQVQVSNYSSGDAKWDFNHVTVSPNAIYTYTEDYKSTVKTSITIEYTLADGTFDYEWVKDIATSTNWTTFSVPIFVPSNAVSFTVLHALTSNGTLTVDNASLVAEHDDAYVQGMVTLSFDDGLLSQYQNAQPILRAANMTAGFYIITEEPTSGDSGQMTWPQIQNLKSQGFEIGGHTRTHPFLTTLTPAQMTDEITGSYQDLVAQGITPKAFVYPYGDINASVEAAVQTAGYTIARGSYYGENSALADPLNLEDIRLDTTSTLPKVEAEIDQALSNKRWLVFEIHDVLASGGDEYSITPGFLQSVVNYLKQKQADVVTLEQGSAFLK